MKSRSRPAFVAFDKHCFITESVRVRLRAHYSMSKHHRKDSKYGEQVRDSPAGVECQTIVAGIS